MSEQKRNFFAPGCSRSDLTKAHSWSCDIMFPVALDSIDVMDAIKRICKERGWVCRSVQLSEHETTPEQWQKLSGITLDPTPFAGFIEEPDTSDA